MADWSLARLADYFRAECDWPDAVLPDYAGGSIANLPASIAQAFRLDLTDSTPLLPPLRPDLLDPQALNSPQIVVPIVVDGLSQAAYTRGVDSGLLVGLPPHSGVLTSVFPSTTAAALTSLHYGIAPARHGIGAYTLYLHGHRRVVNMVRFKPADGGAFTRPGPDPARLITAPTLFDRLAPAGIESVVVSHREYAGSPLTTLHTGSTRYEGHRTAAEFAALLLAATETNRQRVVLGYWAGLDMIAHAWGPESAAAHNELTLLSRALAEGFLQPLERSGRDVIVLITADHGHHTVDPAQAISLAATLRAAGGQRVPPTGERRSIGLSLRRPGSAGSFRELIRQRGAVLDVQSAIDAGLYGPGPVHPELRERIGDVLLLARESTTFLHANALDAERSRGAHGSLTREEMLVPLLCRRFGR